MVDVLQQGVNALQDIVKALHDADKTNTVLVYATIALALATIIFGILDRWRQERERFERVRAWLVIDGPNPIQVILPNGGKISWDLWNQSQTQYNVIPKAVVLGLKITNTGIRPAQNIREAFIEKGDLFEKDELTAVTEPDTQMDLGPNQIVYRPHEISWEKWQQMTDEKPIFVGLSITYYNGKKLCHSGTIYRLIRGQWHVIYSWYD